MTRVSDRTVPFPHDALPESIKVSVGLHWVGWFAAEDDVMSYLRAEELPDTRGEGDESSSPWATTM